jgi:excisionase family DNA binding protein
MDNKLQLLKTKKQLLDKYRPFPKEIEINLQEWFRVELTYTSNAIEGNTLTRQETALVVDEGLTVEGKSLIEHQEAINHSLSLDYIYSLANQKQKLSLNEILEIHNIILNKIDDSNKGRLRTVPVRLKGSETILPNPLKVPELMNDFVVWLQDENQNDPIKFAIDAHFKLVTIHPFVDGNGRVGRLLMNLLLIRSGYPPAIIRKEDRNLYVKSLEKGQTKQDMDDYYVLMINAVERSLDIYLEALNPKEENVNEIQEKRFLTTDEVAKLLQVDPESVRRYVRRGDLKAVKLGGKFIRIEKEDLNKFIESLKK